MPEPEVVKPTESSQQGTPPAAQGATPGGDNAAAWSSKFKSPDEMWSSYSELEKKLGSQGTELGNYKNAYGTLSERAKEYEKAVTAWDAWFKEKVGPHWDDIEKFLASKQGRQAVQQATEPQHSGQPQQQNWAEGWETLNPQQQAQRLQQAAVTQIAQALAPSLQKWQSGFMDQYQKDMAQKEQYYQNYLNLYRRVMDMRMANPNLDVDAVLDNAVKVLSGNTDPIEVGKTLATMSVDRESYAKQMVDQARKDWETEQRNKQMAAVQPHAGNPPAFKLPTAGQKGLASMREDVAKKILEKHGPSVF